MNTMLLTYQIGKELSRKIIPRKEHRDKPTTVHFYGGEHLQGGRNSLRVEETIKFHGTKIYSSFNLHMTLDQGNSMKNGDGLNTKPLFEPQFVSPAFYSWLEFGYLC